MTRLLGILPWVCMTSVRPGFPSNFSSASTAESSPPSALSIRAAGPSSAPPSAKIPTPMASQANTSGASSDTANSTASHLSQKESRIVIRGSPTLRAAGELAAPIDYSRFTIHVFLQLFPHAHRQGGLVRQFHCGHIFQRDSLRLEQGDLARRDAPLHRAVYDLSKFGDPLPRQRPRVDRGDEIAALLPGLLQVVDGNAVAAANRLRVEFTFVRPVRSDGIDVDARPQPFTPQHRILRRAGCDDDINAINGVGGRFHRHDFCCQFLHNLLSELVAMLRVAAG